MTVNTKKIARISKSKLLERCNTFPDVKQALLHWYNIVSKSNWKSPNELKKVFQNASVINDKRVVFNIRGNNYRLIVDIEYRIGLLFIIDVLTHKEYDKINIKNIKYVKTH